MRRHLAPMLDAASRLVNHAGRIRVIVSDAGPVDEVLAAGGPADALWRSLHPIHHRGEGHPVLRAADLAVVASGTATLETAALGVPMVIVYRTGALNFAIARRVVRLPRIGLANIVAGRDAAPELIQDAANGPAIASAAAALLEQGAARDAQRDAFAGLSERLGGEGSADRAAEALLEFIAERAGSRETASAG